jgi:hypothetical protein
MEISFKTIPCTGGSNLAPQSVGEWGRLYQSHFCNVIFRAVIDEFFRGQHLSNIHLENPFPVENSGILLAIQPLKKGVTQQRLKTATQANRPATIAGNRATIAVWIVGAKSLKTFFFTMCQNHRTQ